MAAPYGTFTDLTTLETEDVYDTLEVDFNETHAYEKITRVHKSKRPTNVLQHVSLSRKVIRPRTVQYLFTVLVFLAIAALCVYNHTTILAMHRMLSDQKNALPKLEGQIRNGSESKYVETISAQKNKISMLEEKYGGSDVTAVATTMKPAITKAPIVRAIGCFRTISSINDPPVHYKRPKITTITSTIHKGIIYTVGIYNPPPIYRMTTDGTILSTLILSRATGKGETIKYNPYQDNLLISISEPYEIWTISLDGTEQRKLPIQLTWLWTDIYVEGQMIHGAASRAGGGQVHHYNMETGQLIKRGFSTRTQTWWPFAICRMSDGGWAITTRRNTVIVQFYSSFWSETGFVNLNLPFNTMSAMMCSSCGEVLVLAAGKLWLIQQKTQLSLIKVIPNHSLSFFFLDRKLYIPTGDGVFVYNVTIT